MTTEKTTSSRPSEFIKFMWLIALAGLALLLLLFIFISYTQIPDTEELENPNYEQSSFVYSYDRVELGRYYTHNRDLVTFEELNPYLVDALVATEDERFWSHSGVDAKGLSRAVFFLGKRGGASTITQQLAKLFFTDRSSSFVKRVWQKLSEWVIAAEFEKRYTKEEIIAMYLNKFEFIYNSFGIGAASRTYFGKDQKDLSIDEAAILIGMLKNPSVYNPKRNPDNATKRRNIVLGQMLKNHYISQDDFDSLKELPIDMSNFKNAHHSDGLAPYFRAELTKWLKETLAKDQFRKPDGTTYDIYTDGLQILTTIDSRMQRHAETAMREHMAKQQKSFDRVWANKDPWTDKRSEISVDYRRRKLNQLVRESERYQTLKSSYLQDIGATIFADISDARLRIIDIQRMVREDKKKGHLTKLARDKVITKKESKVYKQIMKSDHWTTLKSQFGKLEQKAKKAFSTPRKMRVFAHNEQGEKTVTMSPMDSIRYHVEQLQLGSMAIEPSTGYVKTWVGGIGHKYFKYDHITSQRQVGSTFKPYIYATAVSEKAISPCLRVPDVQYSIPAGDSDWGLMKTWSPANSNSKFSGQALTLKEGLKLSKNSVSVWLMKQLGSASIVKGVISNMGIAPKKIPNSPSICLGTPQLSVMEMAGAYTTFSNDGTYSKPIFVEQIMDKDGRVIYTASSQEQKALNSEANYAMVDMLRYATKNHSYNLQTTFGGKTGTTDDFIDGWFMGITPNLVVGTWVGGDQKWIRFTNINEGQGGRMARPFFFEFMKKVEADKSLNFDTDAQFIVPENMEIELDCSKYDAIILAEKVEQEAAEEEEDELEDVFEE